MYGAKTYSMTSKVIGLNHTQITTNLYGGTNNTAAFVLRWMFNDYYFMVLIFGHFPDDRSMSSCRKLIHTTTIPIHTA